MMKPLVDFVVYDLRIYRLFPWEYGGRYIFQWPTRVWIKKENKIARERKGE